MEILLDGRLYFSRKNFVNLILKVDVVSLSKLTIVVPTYCRQDYVLRQMEYWSRFDARLVILDGSPFALDLPCQFQAYENILYVHMPLAIEERMAKSVSLVSTEYVALLSDDEFFLPSALKSCLDFLDENPCYSACKGRAIGFGWLKGGVYGVEAYPGLAGYHIDEDTGEARMRQHMAPYEMASLWSIQRRSVFNECMKVIFSGPPFSSAAASEMQISLISAYHGKVMVLDQLLWLRSFENRNIWWENGNLSILEWWRDSNMTDEHKRFLRSIASTKSINNLKKTLDEDSVANAIEAYAKWCEQIGSISISSPRKILGKILPLTFKKMIKKIYIHLVRSEGRNPLSLVATAEKLEISGVHVDYYELIRIELSLREFHNNRAIHNPAEVT